MCCGDCSRLRRLIIANRDNDFIRDGYQSEFLAHVEKQQVYRDIYERVIRKSVSFRYRKYTLSMIIDAAGAFNATNYPRFRTVEKKEYQRHELLKVKLIFAVVHGVLTGVYQSFPDIGCQGANLTLEVVFRGLSRNAPTFLFISLTLVFLSSKGCFERPKYHSSKEAVYSV